METLPCPKCSGTMQIGYVHGRHATLSAWVAGVREWSWFWGMREKGRRFVEPVLTYRCATCGFLESYATRPARRP